MRTTTWNARRAHKNKGTSMASGPKLSYAIAMILGGATRFSHAAPADADSDAIQEITVTAQRRTENMQDVPIQIQALTSETLSQLNVSTFDDFVKYLPNVSSASNGPGQGEIVMRGLSVGGGIGQWDSGATGIFPNVAVYLDDQSGQLPGRNLDVYAADMERIEVLEGPQGTLFGAGAEAGVLRYITNKPKLDVTEGNVNAGYAYTSHGDPSTNIDAMINLPLIPDTLAVRGVIYNDTRGGYINNVPGSFVRQSTDGSIHYAGYANNIPGPATATNSASNNNLVANAINPVTYQGIRAGALLKFNEDWNALLVQSYQSMNAQGVFYETPESSGVPAQPLPDLSVQLYTPAFDKDRFENTALTVNGRIGDLKLVYAAAYLVRNIDAVQDYTNYARGYYADYYQCVPGTKTTKSQCYSPVSDWLERETNTHDSQEMRLSTPDDWRLRGIAGLFWEDYTIHDDTNWNYTSAPGFTNIGPPAGTQVNDPSIRADDVTFLDDIKRGYHQRAAFGSADFDIVPKSLTVTVGTRYYSINTRATGYTAGSFGCFEDGPPPCTGNIPGDVSNLTAEHLDKTYSGFRSRFNLSYRPMDDVLVYYTWSQGFRAGGFNRSSRIIVKPTYTYETPQSYAPDTLINNEIGWKTEWFDHRLQFNGAVYQENWNNVQVDLFEPCCFGNVGFIINDPSYRVRGVETQVIARATHNLTITGSAAWNSSDLTKSPPLIATDGKPITSITDPVGAVGSPLAQSPPFQANLRARYEFEFGDYHAFYQIGGTHQAHSLSQTGNVLTYDQPGFTTYDGSLGVAKDAWTVQLYGQNLTDTRADLYSTYDLFIKSETVNRPRTAGLKFSYKF